MFTVSQQNCADREQVLRGEITTAVTRSEKKTDALSAQVQHITSSLQVIRDQQSTNSDFSVDALEQVRAKFRGDIEAMQQSMISTYLKCCRQIL